MRQQLGFQVYGASPHMPKYVTLLPPLPGETEHELTLTARPAPTPIVSPACTWACLYGAQIITPRIVSFPNQGQSLPVV